MTDRISYETEAWDYTKLYSSFSQPFAFVGYSTSRRFIHGSCRSVVSRLFHNQNVISLLFFLICIVGGGVQTGSTWHVGHLLAHCTCPGWLWRWRIWYSEKTCPDATLSTTNPTWPDPGLNPGRRGGKPATNRFSYGAANFTTYPVDLATVYVTHVTDFTGIAPKRRTLET
jgi:hypothetical protein